MNVQNICLKYNMSYFENKDLFIQPKVAQYGSNMIMTNVLKENKTKYVNIDTKFGDEYKDLNSKSEYTITLSEKITDVKKTQIKSIEMPVSFYNISSNLGNNSFQIIVNAETNNVIIPDGHYSADDLINKINELILNYNATFSLSNKFKIQNNNSDSQITIIFNTDDKGHITKYNFKSRLGWLMGFRQNQYIVEAMSFITAEAMYDLNVPKYLYIAIDEFGKGNQNSFISPLPTSLINKNIIARICCDNNQYPYGSVLYANEYNGLLISDIRSYTGKIDIQKLNIKLLNEYGIVIDLNGLDYSFLLKLEHE